ncbi:DUF6270 domain-containing protein [Nocardioides sp. Root151]|uniref:DUF6270 domain-containing protein n=1 Tax=Nocardioides sp. Root151 TaxID=1736475 RepID=UPI0007025AC0|nr:DUF6270 domain-containing protein [Nocardioides sp. Root151]KQZ75831.1 hypothetical protein ASD66_05790 [Nocardioides sp. Root151]
MSDPRVVVVMGSCITRDNFNSRFNADYKQWFEVGATTNQSSMIALMSPPVDEPWEPLEPMKPYGLWNVASDLNREILGLIAENPPEILILDFFGDVHFGVLRMADGRFVTNNRWRIHKTDLYQRLIDDERTEVLSWQADADAYFELWTEAMDRFAAFVTEHCPTTRVIVHCGFNATEVMRPNLPIPGRLHPVNKEVRLTHVRGNDFWARLNKYASTSYGWDSIDLGGESYTSFKEHPWGPFEVHYTMDYYHRFLGELHRLALRDDLAPDVMTKVDEIADASAERVRTELDRLSKAFDAVANPPARPSPTGWRKLLPRKTGEGTDPGPPAEVACRDHDLLDALRGYVDDETFERVAQLPASADEHVAVLRGIWLARIERRRDTDGSR